LESEVVMAGQILPLSREVAYLIAEEAEWLATGERPARRSEHEDALPIEYVLDRMETVFPGDEIYPWLATPHESLEGRAPIVAVSEGELERVLSLIDSHADRPPLIGVGQQHDG
jgi:hypothetical protein